ncbi:Alpha/Beta hydrolase protein [Aspergillus spectabilis]
MTQIKLPQQSSLLTPTYIRSEFTSPTRQESLQRSLIESPSRSLPVPNSSGQLAVYIEQYYTQHTTALKSAIWVIELNSVRRWPIPDTANARYPQWLGHSNQLIWLESLDNGHTQFVVGDARLQRPAYIAGTVIGPVWDLRTAGVVFKEDRGDDDDLSFAVIGEANPDGTLFNPVEAERAGSVQLQVTEVSGATAQRWQKHGYARRKNVIWFGCLARPSDSSPSGRYTIPGVTNLMTYFNLGDVSLETSHNQSCQEICQDFYMTTWVIMFAAKDPEVDGLRHTAGSCYICPIVDWSGLIVPDDYYKAFRHRGLGGTISSPVANKKGAMGFLSQKRDGYAADKNRIILVNDLHSGTYKEIFASADGKGQWDLSPSSFSFASDGHLLLKVEEQGQRVLYKLSPMNGTGESGPTPADLQKIEPLFKPLSSLVAVTPVTEESPTILLTCDSFIYERDFILKNLVTGATRDLLHNFPWASLSENQIDSIWFPSADNRKIHAWVIKPSHFNPEKKYPLAYLIHSNHHSSWTSSWANDTGRLNLDPVFLAEHGGYVVVAPNITGSSGYGQDFVNGTRYSFAGAPYEDLKQGFKYLQTEPSLSYIDTSRAVALGGSGYGGYMINWIQGQELGRRFRALVSYNGIFNIMSYLSSSGDVPQSIMHEMGGPPWADRETAEEWKRWDPSRFLHNWNTPQLIVHGALDRDHPISDSVAAARTLQLRGVDCSFLRFDDEGGVVRRPANVVLLYQTVLEWMDQYTR